MADYLAVPFARQERVVHEKARSARRGELRWLRTYIADVVDDPELFGEPLALRFLDLALVALAAQHDWMIPLDTRWIAGQIGGVRGRELTWQINRLLELGRMELVTVSNENRNGGPRQPALFPTASSTVRQPSGNRPADTRQTRRDTPADTTILEESQLAARAASQRLAQTRSREELDLRQGLEGSKENPSEISKETNPVTQRLIGIGRIDPASASARFVTSETTGLPDAAIVSVIESYLRKRPRPVNPAGWIVNALRAQRRERADPEPEL